VNVVDSSGWLEYFADGPNAAKFATPIEDTARLVVPTISILEVFKRLLRQRGENDALRGAAAMHQGRVVSLDAELALAAAKLGTDYSLPLADSVILATAHRFGATLWTQDEDFKGMDGVKYFAKRKP
jgi:predicted nucleic acid-binding protein